MKKVIIIVIMLQMMFALGTFAFAEMVESMNSDNIYSEKALVLEVESQDILSNDNEFDDNFIYDEIQIVTLKVLTGEYKGQIVTVENYLGGNKVSDIRVEKGQRVILSFDEFEDGSKKAYINSYERDRSIYILLVIFILAILVVGKMQGLKTLITLAITVLIVFMFTIPMILKAYNPIIISVVSCVFITIITLFIISGINEKSFSAIISTAISVVISGVLAYVIGHFARLTGMDMTEGTMLIHLPQNIDFDFRGLLFAGIIIGTLGAAMDMCMSVTSSMHEIMRHNEGISLKQLFNSGLKVGKDVMGTMTNTLILAYTGSALPILLVFMAYQTPYLDIINLDNIATEIVRSIAGSTGVVLSVPITAYVVIAAEKIKRKKTKFEKN
ncbi:YibE/F family protein [Sedimentibacter sp. zth1]|uniref:YibE/F family protein n=1 Tax=Sedimentibacter sp. zth1 TaxID=2816908 RepID=UPI001A9294CF|nr:YibE/F family protein [Sedimentibacter sp. zth1]QSX05571.1 YibE/F family protein [Sedimentibacter sp. zth1]